MGGRQPLALVVGVIEVRPAESVQQLMTQRAVRLHGDRLDTLGEQPLGLGHVRHGLPSNERV
jgi:hypothetical protein